MVTIDLREVRCACSFVMPGGKRVQCQRTQYAARTLHTAHNHRWTLRYGASLTVKWNQVPTPDERMQMQACT